MAKIPAATVVALCKTRLVAGIAALDEYADATPNPVVVSWSHPFGKLEARHAWVGDFHGTQDWAAIGNRAREVPQPSVFDFSIFVSSEGATAQDVETEAMALLGAVEAWLRDEETAGIDLSELPGCQHLRLAVDRFDIEGGANDKARAVLVSADISLVARI